MVSIKITYKYVFILMIYHNMFILLLKINDEMLNMFLHILFDSFYDNFIAFAKEILLIYFLFVDIKDIIT